MSESEVGQTVQATVPTRKLKKTAKEILLEKTDAVASSLTLTEKNIVLDDYPNPDNNTRLYKTNITCQDQWIDYVIKSLRSGNEPYKKVRRNVLPSTQTQLHHHAASSK